MIYESKDLATMDTHTLFGKQQEHEIELKRLAIDEEGEKKNKSLALKVEESGSDGDMHVIVKNFKLLLWNDKKKKKSNKKIKKKDH